MIIEPTTGQFFLHRHKLADGGTNASLVASNGGIVYSTASALAILAGTATANQILLSGLSTTPAWSTSTYPATNAINTLLYASSANVMAALATANSGVLVTSGTGVPSIGTDIPTAVTIGAAYIYRVSGTDVAVADGGTGASDAGTARTNLSIASRALDNLASVAINTSLISDTDSTDNLGSTTVAWANLYVDTISSITGNALALTPVSGQSLTVNLATTGDFAVNTNQLYVDTSAGNVGIGTTSPAGLLHVSSDTAATGLSFFTQANASADGFDQNFRKARGTGAVPTVITTGDELGVINFTGYGGAAGYITGAAIKGISAGTIADSRVPGQLSFWTGTDAAPSVLTERMRIDEGGNVGIGITAATKFHVSSSISTELRVETTSASLDTLINMKTANRAWALYNQNTDSNKFAIRDETGAAFRLTIDTSGNVGIAETAPDYKLDVNGSFGFTPGTSVTPVDNGDVTIAFTNNTTLTFSGKGTDGVVRSGTLTLA